MNVLKPLFAPQCVFAGDEKPVHPVALDDQSNFYLRYFSNPFARRRMPSSTFSIEEAKEILSGPESFLSEWRDFFTVLRMLQYRVAVDHPELAKTITDAQRISPFR